MTSTPSLTLGYFAIVHGFLTTSRTSSRTSQSRDSYHCFGRRYSAYVSCHPKKATALAGNPDQASHVLTSATPATSRFPALLLSLPLPKPSHNTHPSVFHRHTTMASNKTPLVQTIDPPSLGPGNPVSTTSLQHHTDGRTSDTTATCTNTTSR